MRTEYTYRRITTGGEASAEITGAEGAGASLYIPEELGGFPVRSIGKSAFANWEEPEEIRLADGIRRLGDFAFYGCRSLRTISLTDSVEDVGDGVIRSCGALKTIRVRVLRDRFRVIKDLLADQDGEVRFHIDLPEGEAELFFPAYVNDFDEDTMARAIHPRIEGCGYAFREAVTRSGIDFWNYDSQFPRTEADGWRIIGEVALSRLMYPFRLTETAEQWYEAGLRRVSGEFLPYLVRERRTEGVRYLLSAGLPERRAAGESVRTASEAGLTEICGMLMDYERGGEAARGTSAAFTLEEL